MCGLAGGISGTLVPSERSVIRDLLGNSYYRGSHSTGMMSWTREVKEAKKKGEQFSPFIYYKTLQHSLDFVGLEYLDAEKKYWKDCEPTFIAGHTRSATLGPITKKNAHPFNHSPIYGMHNGTVTGAITNKEMFETDSECIFYNIKTMGLHKALEDINENGFSPAYALVWFNREDETLNFLRNSLRPLHIATLAGERTWYWASDAELLQWIFFQNKISGAKIREIPVHKHMRFKLRDQVLSFEEAESLPEGSKWRKNSYPAPWKRDEEYGGSYYSKTKDTPHPFGGATNPDYFVQFAREHKNGVFDQYDVASGKWMTTYQFNQTKLWRELARQAAETISRADDEAARQEVLEKVARESPGGSQDSNGNFTSTKQTETFSQTTFRRGGKKDRKFPRPIGKELGGSNVLPLFPSDNLNDDLTHSWGYNNSKKCTKAAWHQKTKNGCTYCGDPVSEDETLFWTGNEYDFLCEKCQRQVAEGVDEAKHILQFIPQAMELVTSSNNVSIN